MPEPGPKHEELDVLAAEFVEQCRRGDCPSVSQYATNHPELATEIRDLFPTIAAVERLKTRRQMSRGGRASLGGVQLERLGDFRIVREIGRGGMGIVYEAEQESLLRRVAVKVLPQTSLLNPQALRRFQREAQTAARLHHTNIVPVFGVGEDHGFHYIVMQLIQGVGLDTILGEMAATKQPSAAATQPKTEQHANSTTRPAAVETSQSTSRPTARQPSVAADGTSAASLFGVGASYWQSVARIGAQAARALQYAHQRGTLHRDIKPANLLVDTQGVVWISDFGLAKALEHDEVSHTGDVVGTLRYMAPERFAGESDARSDIYSLGLSLYEMLTLRPAFEQSHPSALMRRITNEQPVRPRAINPDIPADLETIVVKAIAREPGHRYASAEELAEDLERFLTDRPIRARRVSVAERLWRWARRNRAVASLAGLAVALLILVAVVASVGYVRTKIANRQVRDALADELQQRQKVETMSELTLEALDDIFEQFVPSQIGRTSELAFDDATGGVIRVPVQPVLSKESAALLERMLPFYDRLAEQDTANARLRRKVADANRRVGVIHRRLGHLEQAQAAYLRAIESYRQLEQVSPGDVAIGAEIARIYNDLGDLCWTARCEGEGRAFHLKAIAILKTAPASPASQPQSRYELARTYYFLGRGGPPGAAPGLRPPRASPPATPPRPQNDRRGPAVGLSREDTVASPTDQPRRENTENIQQAIQLLESLVDEHPGIAEYRHLLACCYRDLPLAGPDGTKQPLMDSARKATEILQKLADDFPDIPDYQYDLSKTYAQLYLGGQLVHADSETAAEEPLRKSLSIAERLAVEHPNVPDYTFSQVYSLYAMAEMLRHTRQPDTAKTTLRKALTLQSSLVEQFPQAITYKTWKAILQESLAKLLAGRGQASEARALLESAVAELDQLLKSEPHAPYFHNLLGRCYQNLAEVLSGMGEKQQAAEMLRRGREHRIDRPLQ